MELPLGFFFFWILMGMCTLVFKAAALAGHSWKKSMALVFSRGPTLVRSDFFSRTFCSSNVPILKYLCINSAGLSLSVPLLPQILRPVMPSLSFPEGQGP